MRISDWSSDVCSSDLRAVFESLAHETARNVEGFMAGLNLRVATEVARALASARRVRMHGVRQNHAFASFLAYGLGMLRGDGALLDAAQLGPAEALAQLEPDEIGIASGRERVCRYV